MTNQIVMNKKISGGLVLFNLNKGKEPTFLIAHPGGPFFKNRDDGWWSIPKGEPEANESIFEAAFLRFYSPKRKRLLLITLLSVIVCRSHLIKEFFRLPLCYRSRCVSQRIYTIKFLPSMRSAYPCFCDET